MSECTYTVKKRAIALNVYVKDEYTYTLNVPRAKISDYIDSHDDVKPPCCVPHAVRTNLLLIDGRVKL